MESKINKGVYADTIGSSAAGPCGRKSAAQAPQASAPADPRGVKELRKAGRLTREGTVAADARPQRC
jgi:hypothetical protein